MSVAQPDSLRRCKACDQKKAAEAFYPSYKSQCRECLKRKAAPKRQEKIAYLREWRKRNPSAFKEWYSGKRQNRAEYWREWYEKNKKRRSVSYSEWARKNKHIVNALIARRTATKIRATPLWADHDAMRAIYAEAVRLTTASGVKHEVDHIVPLCNPVVCGLHWEGNLRVITKVENIRKSNRLLETI